MYIYICSLTWITSALNNPLRLILLVGELWGSYISQKYYPNVNTVARLVIELTNYDAAILYIRHYISGTRLKKRSLSDALRSILI